MTTSTEHDPAATQTGLFLDLPEPSESDLESLLPEDHRARLVWGYVERQDLSRLIEAVEARDLYKQRAATAECVNAQAHNRGLLRMPVRGLPKVRSVVGLFVLVHNLLRMAVLAPQLIGWGTDPSAMAAQAA